jgi:hypothetical protein
MKLTIDQAIDIEAQNLADALCSGCLELNDEFLSRYFSEGLSKLLKLIPCEKERAFILDSHLTDDNWRTMSGFDSGADINLPVGEIEVQFEGKAVDYFEDPSDWYVSGDLAYLAVAGICWTVDLDSLQQDINDWTENQLAEIASGVTC